MRSRSNFTHQSDYRWRHSLWKCYFRFVLCYFSVALITLLVEVSFHWLCNLHKVSLMSLRSSSLWSCPPDEKSRLRCERPQFLRDILCSEGTHQSSLLLSRLNRAHRELSSRNGQRLLHQRSTEQEFLQRKSGLKASRVTVAAVRSPLRWTSRSHARTDQRTTLIWNYSTKNSFTQMGFMLSRWASLRFIDYFI